MNLLRSYVTKYKCPNVMCSPPLATSFYDMNPKIQKKVDSNFTSANYA